jgi:hypothetical protein
VGVGGNPGAPGHPLEARIGKGRVIALSGPGFSVPSTIPMGKVSCKTWEFACGLHEVRPIMQPDVHLTETCDVRPRIAGRAQAGPLPPGVARFSRMETEMQ